MVCIRFAIWSARSYHTIRECRSIRSIRRECSSICMALSAEDSFAKPNQLSKTSSEFGEHIGQAFTNVNTNAFHCILLHSIAFNCTTEHLHWKFFWHKPIQRTALLAFALCRYFRRFSLLFVDTLEFYSSFSPSTATLHCYSSILTSTASLPISISAFPFFVATNELTRHSVPTTVLTVLAALTHANLNNYGRRILMPNAKFALKKW